MKKKKARKLASKIRVRMGGLINTFYTLIKLLEVWF